MTRWLVILGMGLGPVASIGRADEPPETLPPPRAPVVVDSLPLFEGPPVFPYERRDRWQVWQYYAVGHQGFYRPRVIDSPLGAYYLFNGAPFPYTSTRMLEFMPYALE